MKSIVKLKFQFWKIEEKMYCQNLTIILWQILLGQNHDISGQYFQSQYFEMVNNIFIKDLNKQN